VPARTATFFNDDPEEFFVRYSGIFRLRATPRRAVATGLAALAIGALLSPAPATADVTCQELAIPVSLVGQRETVHGQFCQPGRPASTVLVLVPGGTYTSGYWDLPANLGLVSFRAGMNDLGYATLAIDRLGTGRSSKPVSALLTTLTQAGVLHQLVGKLRTGEIGPGYPKVIVGGHSLGAAISLVEAATYHDVDGVLSAGIAHQFDPLDSATNLLASLTPAALDPLLSGRNYDLGYLTTAPGTRTRAFHLPARPPAAVVAHEESTKDAFATTEAADALGVAAVSPYTILIDVPVLVALGGQDELYCAPPLLVGIDCTSADTFRRDEAPYYAPAARLRAYLLPGSYGHAFNYAPNAAAFCRTVAQWADEMVGA
jgi:pimeloyl-ACP methyl ester carboxylesterase